MSPEGLARTKFSDASFRNAAAVEAMKGILANPQSSVMAPAFDAEVAANRAALAADALVKRLAVSS